MNKCEDCERKRAECPWKGSVLDYAGLIPYHLKKKLDKGEITMHDIYPMSSSYLRCDKHSTKKQQ